MTFSYSICWIVWILSQKTFIFSVSTINLAANTIHICWIKNTLVHVFTCLFLRELNTKSPLKFVHSSFHGVGHDYVQQAFRAFGFPPPIPVPEQKDPDPNFSTVSCPNPEEGESVLVRKCSIHLTFQCYQCNRVATLDAQFSLCVNCSQCSLLLWPCEQHVKEVLMRQPRSCLCSIKLVCISLPWI